MKFTRLRWLGIVGAIALLVGGSSQARIGHESRGSFERSQNEGRLILTGQLNDQTVASMGSWVMHGVWTLDRKDHAGTADFTAGMSMERSDYWFLTNLNPPADPNSLAARNTHTHHIGLQNAAVTLLPTGFRLNGPASLTGNGAVPPFGTNSTLQVDVTGGDLVAYSNVTLTFGGDAAKHFGANPVAGVVSGAKKD